MGWNFFSDSLWEYFCEEKLGESLNGRQILFLIYEYYKLQEVDVKLFDFKGDPARVELHFDRDGSELSDFSGLHALNIVADKYKKQDKKLVVKYLSAGALRMLAKAEAIATFDVAVTGEEEEQDGVDEGKVVVEMARW